SPTPHTHPFPTRRSSDLDDAGQREHRPAEAVNDQHGFEIFARPRFEASVERERVSVARARQEEGAQRAAIVVSIGYPSAEERPRSEEHTSELQSRFDLVC